MSEFLNEDALRLRQSLKEFLSLESNTEPEANHCTRCGAGCMHLHAHFWLAGEEEIFSIWLPFCPYCNPELLTRKPAIA